MLRVQHFARMRHIQIIRRDLIPRQIEQPIQIRANDARLRRLQRHLVQPFQFLLGLEARLFRQVLGGDLFTQFVDLARQRIAFAQLGLNGLHLLAQIELALAAIDFALHPRMDLIFEFENVQFFRQQNREALQAILRTEGLQQFLLDGHIHLDRRRDQIGQPARLGHVHGVHVGVFRQGPIELDHLLEQGQHGAHQGFGGCRFADRIVDAAALSRDSTARSGRIPESRRGAGPAPARWWCRRACAASGRSALRCRSGRSLPGAGLRCRDRAARRRSSIHGRPARPRSP